MTLRTPSPDWDLVEDAASWDIVDEASLESFPASDPPAWGSYHAVATETTTVTPLEAFAPRARPRIGFAGILLGVLAGAVVLGATSLVARRLREVR